MSDSESYYQTGLINGANQDEESQPKNLYDHRGQLNPNHELVKPAAPTSHDVDDVTVENNPVTIGKSSRKASSNSRSRSGSGSTIGLDSSVPINAIPKRKPRSNSISNISTNDSVGSDAFKKDRTMSRVSIDSEADSHASRSSQETEEDVCFPMSREHIRINGIDFDEIEEFIKEERDQQNLLRDQQYLNDQGSSSDARSTGTSINKPSSSALKYTPKNILKNTNTALTKLKSRLTGVDNEEISSLQSLHSGNDSPIELEKFHYKVDDHHKGRIEHEFAEVSDGVKIEGAVDAHVNIDRFSFFTSDSDETVHVADIPSLVKRGQTVRELFRNGEPTWWLDCTCPTDVEMKVLAKAFGIHPLTAEDIRMQEAREKVELFRNYYFVCFHTFEADKESEDYLEPINVYMVVFREGILTFHFSPITHPANVRRRVRQLRDYVEVTADWLCYALIDDITDSFAPVITGIEYEADAIEDSVFLAREADFEIMLSRIGESRRKVMTLMRLLSGKADVIKMFAKRCQDEASSFVNHSESMDIGELTGIRKDQGMTNESPSPTSGGVSFGPAPGASAAVLEPVNQWQFQTQGNRTQPRADIALYLGDIQDHVVTMFQNLAAYEKIFSRSHANYLAQLQVESVKSNNRITDMLSRVSLIGTVLIPLNIITGLFGMNVTVPGEQTGKLGWFFGIVGFMVIVASCCYFLGRAWVNRVLVDERRVPVQGTVRSIKSFGLRRNAGAKSIISFPNRYE
ncbi:magnesium transporter ALR1 [Scheffersomyces amazonensis]|uniref:magnesium transporter ALR1 n=1 Tax=Scheffersomyces amazonensis TaxID=1078765 RepID=UPI00315D2E07